MVSHCALLFFIVLSLSGRCLSQTVCNFVLFGTYESVSVDGGLCFLISSNVTGKVTVTGGGLLFSQGSKIKRVEAISAFNVFIEGSSSVTELLSFTNSNNIFIDPRSSVNRIIMKGSRGLQNRGFIGTLTLDDSRRLDVPGGVIGSPSSYALFIQGGQPLITLCGAKIGFIQTKDSSTRFIAENSARCPRTNISALNAVGSEGSVAVSGLTLTNDVSFSAFNLKSVDFNSTTFRGRVGMRFIADGISLTSVTAEDRIAMHGTQTSTELLDSTFKEVMTVGAPERSSAPTKDGMLSTSISGCTFERDLKLGPVAGNVTISGSIFSDSKVYVETRTGHAELTGNKGLRLLRVQRNSVGVDVTDNEVSNGEFRSNAAKVSLLGNTFEKLSCFGNKPSPMVANNTIGNGIGQCRLA